MLVVYEVVKDDKENIIDETNIFDSDKTDAIAEFFKEKRDLMISGSYIRRSIREKFVIKDRYRVRKVKEI